MCLGVRLGRQRNTSGRLGRPNPCPRLHHPHTGATVTATPMTDGDRLLRSILAAPDDDAPRLIYADWLEENGQTDRAEFIRVQCASAMLEEKSKTRDFSIIRRIKLVALDERALELFSTHGAAWFGPNATTIPPSERERQAGGEFRIVRRGFVEHVAADLATLIGGPCEQCHGRGHRTIYGDGSGPWQPCQYCGSTGRTPGILRELVNREPVTSVRATDREPFGPLDETQDYGWFDVREYGDSADDLSDLPSDLYSLLPGGEPHHQGRSAGLYYLTADAAHAALSASILTHARSRAAT